MCDEYVRKIELDRALATMDNLGMPPFTWWDDSPPKEMGPQSSIKVRNRGFVIRLRVDRQHLVGKMKPWAWTGPRGKPVFNFTSEQRDFRQSDRVLILATGFYEYTTPTQSRAKLKDRHLFQMVDQDWFWIAGIARNGCFTMLTIGAGPDIAPYCHRQVVVLPPAAGMDWLTLSQPQSELLKAPPAGTLMAEMHRRNSIVALARQPRELS